MRVFLVNLLLAGIWAAAQGRIDLGNLATGFVLGYLVLGWLRPAAGGSRYFTKGPRAVGLALFFFWELLVSTLRVARDVVTARRYRRPGILAVPLEASTDAEITLLAILVTLTPGTLTLDVSDDRAVMYVHAMFVDDPEEVRRSIKQGFERRILDLLR